MSRYIEYYEYKDIYQYPPQKEFQYYHMAVDKDCMNKRNLDYGSNRIWKYDTWFDTVVYEKYHRDCGEYATRNKVDMDEFNQIAFASEPCPYADEYLMKQELIRKGIIK